MKVCFLFTYILLIIEISSSWLCLLHVECDGSSGYTSDLHFGGVQFYSHRGYPIKSFLTISQSLQAHTTSTVFTQMQDTVSFLNLALNMWGHLKFAYEVLNWTALNRTVWSQTNNGVDKSSCRQRTEQTMTKSLTQSSCFGLFQLSNILKKHDEVSEAGSVAICRQKSS